MSVTKSVAVACGVGSVVNWVTVVVLVLMPKKLLQNVVAAASSLI